MNHKQESHLKLAKAYDIIQSEGTLRLTLYNSKTKKHWQANKIGHTK
jgi:hypothetical protein